MDDKTGKRRAVIVVTEEGSFPAWEYADGTIKIIGRSDDFIKIAEEIVDEFRGASKWPTSRIKKMH